MRWFGHRGGAQHHARWGKEKTEPLPAAIVIGADLGHSGRFRDAGVRNTLLNINSLACLQRHAGGVG